MTLRSFQNAASARSLLKIKCSMEHELIIGPPTSNVFGNEEVVTYSQNALKVYAAKRWGLVGSLFAPQQSYNRAIAKILNATGK